MNSRKDNRRSKDEDEGKELKKMVIKAPEMKESTRSLRLLILPHFRDFETSFFRKSLLFPFDFRR